MRRYDVPVHLVDGLHLVTHEEKNDTVATTYLGNHFGTSLSNRHDLSYRGTIAHQILATHALHTSEEGLSIKFDALASHDITYVGIIQSARHGGLTEFPVPYILTNCHNSLCAVGGTINEDDHIFGLGIAKKYGGIFVPAFQAVIHQYIREMHAGCNTMILGSDSHTRYGALGCMGIGEGGPELVKQVLGRTYDIPWPKVIAVYLEGAPLPGVGPQDVALALIREVFHDGFAKNAILEFVGPGIASLSVDFRNSLDAMTTETTCLSSVWMTDQKVQEYLGTHGRAHEFASLKPGLIARYDGAVRMDLSEIRPMIALPFHPSNVYAIEDVQNNPHDILQEAQERGLEQLDRKDLRFSLLDKINDGRIMVDQGSVSGCAGGSFENICAVADILGDAPPMTDSFWLSVYPASQPINLALMRTGRASSLARAGVSLHPAFCGPCFGAGDTPGNGCLSIRHATRNFPHREGSKPQQGQVSMVALMDARSIAATARNGGRLTAATELAVTYSPVDYDFDASSYKSRVYQGFRKALPETELVYGPYIADWPRFSSLPQDLILQVAASIHDPVTTTDEIIPSGEISSYRSNPEKFAEYTLSRKVPQYVGRAKAIREMERSRQNPTAQADGEIVNLTDRLRMVGETSLAHAAIGSAIFARKPGDGSAREQAASCQKVLGGWANIAGEYATKRYRSNLINWGIFPFIVNPEDFARLPVGTILVLRGLRDALVQGETQFEALLVSQEENSRLQVSLPGLSPTERDILLSGCLMNYYRDGN